MFLKDKVALVTGGSRGIGAAIARVLAGYGADVAVNYLSGADLAEDVVSAIRTLGRRAIAIKADVTSAFDAERMIEQAEKRFGPIDILVNNAGHNPLHSIDRMNEADWDAVLALNLKSYFLCTKAVLPAMTARGTGHIINISSISGQRGGLSCDVDYSAAKAGIMGFTRSLARWAAPRGILVNAIAPGYIMTENLRAACSEERLAELVSSIPLGRLGTPEDIGEVAAFLAGPGGAYMVGEVMTVNGGVHIA
jgi:3-oxoacyl-[acyl-carrier protein] reductase